MRQNPSDTKANVVVGGADPPTRSGLGRGGIPDLNFFWRGVGGSPPLNKIEYYTLRYNRTHIVSRGIYTR